MKVTFIPIFKTKRTAEFRALNTCLSLFNEMNIPYLEVIHFLGESRESGTKFLDSVKSISHFAQYIRKQIPLPMYLDKTLDFVGNKNRIISIQLNEADIEQSKERIKTFISKLHNYQHCVAIRMAVVTSIGIISEIFGMLKNDDYLIIDYDTNDYNALLAYTSLISKEPHECRIVAFSNERPKKAARLYEDGDYNYDFNTSVIDAIKKNSFLLDAFGSYCTAKNDLTEEVRRAQNVYGVFLIYSFQVNSFFSIKTDKGDHISRAYTPLKEKLQSKIVQMSIRDFFEKTALSRKMLSEILNKSNGKNVNCVDFLATSITHYIEEIHNNTIS